MLLKILEELGNDYQFLLKKEINQARITVKHRITNMTHSQSLPLDGHLEDNRLLNYIKFCKTKIEEKL